MEKEDFIKIISSSSKEEINRIIKEKGKRPKSFSPVTFVNKKIKEKK